MEIGSHTTSEMRFLRSDQPTGEFKLINPRRQDHEYYADDHGDQFLIRTNDKGRNFRLVTAPISDPGEKNWKELVPHRPAVMLSNIDVFKDFYVRIERENALPHLTLVDFKSGATHRIEMPEPVYYASPNNNRGGGGRGRAGIFGERAHAGIRRPAGAGLGTEATPQGIISRKTSSVLEFTSPT